MTTRTTPQIDGPHRPGWARAWIPVLILGAVALAAYHNSFRSPYFFDDHRCLLENPSIRDLGNLGAVLSPAPHTMLGSRPLANLSFALNHAVGGLSVTGFHVVNFALHLAAACTLLGLVRRSLGHGLALAVAAAWVAHPLLVPAVSYISQRTEVLMGLFYLVTVYAFVRGAEKGHRGWFVLSALACAAGMGAKEVMITAPLAVLLCDRTFFAGSFAAALRQRPGYYAALAASWLVLLVLMRRGLDPTVGLERGVSAWDYALVQCKVLALYATRAVWPHSLAFDYGEFAAIGVLEAARNLWAPAVVVGGLVYACLRRSALAFWLGWIALTLAPTSSFVPIGLQPMADNRTYLALIGALVALAWLFFRILGSRVFLACGVGLPALAGLSIERNRVFSDPILPWIEAVQSNPANVRALNNLAVALQQSGRLAEAERHYLGALARKPDSASLHSSYASLLLAQGRTEMAIQHDLEAVWLAPDFAQARGNLGASLISAGRYEEAIVQLREALRLDATLGRVHHNLALALVEKGRVTEALPHFPISLERQPGNAALHRRYGQALHAVGRRADALASLQTSLRFAPEQPDVHFLAGVILVEEGRLAESLRAMQAAAALNPDYYEARHNAALILEQLGRPAEALREIEEALRVRPDSAASREVQERLRSAAAPAR